MTKSLFAIAEPGYPMAGYSSFFSTPATAAMRRDPRFMPLMLKIGLVDTWRRTGRWADFCADPDLPIVAGRKPRSC